MIGVYIHSGYVVACVCGVCAVVIVALCVHVCSGSWLHTVWLCVHMWKSTLGVTLLSETTSHWSGVGRVGESQGGWPKKPRNPLPQHWDHKQIPHAQLFTRVLGTEGKPSYWQGKHHHPSLETVGQLWNLAL